MTVHNLYLFDRNGVCLHYSEWHRKKQAGIPKEEEYKLMYGMLFSIRSFVSKMSPLDMKDGFLAFQTSRYKLHYYETPTGMKVVMNTDLGVGPIRDVLHHIYSALYVELVVKNPLCPLGQTVQSELFRSRLDSTSALCPSSPPGLAEGSTLPYPQKNRCLPGAQPNLYHPRAPAASLTTPVPQPRQTPR